LRENQENTEVLIYSYPHVTQCALICYSMANSPSVNQMNQEIQQGRAPSTIKRIDPANPPRFDRYIHVHFTDGSALYINGEWKHGSKKLTNAEKEWLKKNGWENI
jgi:hypothetical protein